MRKMNESRSLVLYKKLLRVLGEYSKTFPATGVDRLFDQAVAAGTKILPSDKKALEILDSVLNEKDISNSVQTLLNAHFSCLPVKYRPLSKKGRRHEVAFWTRGDQKYDRVQSLLNMEGQEKGKWTDIDGNAVQLVEMSEEQKES